MASRFSQATAERSRACLERIGAAVFRQSLGVNFGYVLNGELFYECIVNDSVTFGDWKQLLKTESGWQRMSQSNDPIDRTQRKCLTRMKAEMLKVPSRIIERPVPWHYMNLLPGSCSIGSYYRCIVMFVLASV